MTSRWALVCGHAPGELHPGLDPKFRCPSNPPVGEPGHVTHVDGRRAIRSGGTVWIETTQGLWVEALYPDGFVDEQP